MWGWSGRNTPSSLAALKGPTTSDRNHELETLKQMAFTLGQAGGKLGTELATAEFDAVKDQAMRKLANEHLADYKVQADADMYEGFGAFLSGELKASTTDKFVKIPFVGDRAMMKHMQANQQNVKELDNVDALCVPWKDHHLLHIPGAHEFLSNEYRKRKQFDIYIGTLYAMGPQTMDQAWHYYKYIVKQQRATDREIEKSRRKRSKFLKSKLVNSVVSNGKLVNLLDRKLLNRLVYNGNSWNGKFVKMKLVRRKLVHGEPLTVAVPLKFGRLRHSQQRLGLCPFRPGLRHRLQGLAPFDLGQMSLSLGMSKKAGKAAAKPPTSEEDDDAGDASSSGLEAQWSNASAQGDIKKKRMLMLNSDTYEEVNIPRLAQWDSSTAKLDGTVIAIGKRRTGKSFAFRHILHSLAEHFPAGLCISQTDELNKYWRQYMPAKYIFSKYDPEILHAERETKARFFIILDDVISDKRIRYDAAIAELFVAGRHYKLVTMITTQYAKAITPTLRSNADYVLILHNKQEGQRESLWRDFADFMTKEAFYTLMDFYTEDNEVLIVDTSDSTAKPWEVLKWFKASDPGAFMLGDEEYWAGVNGGNVIPMQST
ncbi:hypothetical protein T492DRAFT_891135 [Pavlovales sp. CCMP2436]|nr:hypothetical protein T492DRAFT_891135 [Pavlovales sp. CCMP2436]